MKHDWPRALRIVRAARDLTQAQLAAKAEIDPTYVSLIEAGHRVPSPDVLNRIAVAMCFPLFLLSALAMPGDHWEQTAGRETLALVLVRQLAIGNL